MILEFNIPQDTATRILPVLDTLGFVYDAENPKTEEEQRWDYFTVLTMQHWDSLVFNYERQLAIDNEPNDTAAEQALRYTTPEADANKFGDDYEQVEL
jgi:hypothetical protein